jgi:hypothetical protein
MATDPTTSAVDVPWIVSVDDHVIEPPSLWAARLPARHRAAGPRVERLPAGDLALSGARYAERPGTDGPLVDYWVVPTRWLVTDSVDDVPLTATAKVDAPTLQELLARKGTPT